MNAKLTNVTGERIAGRAGADHGDAALLSVNQVAKLLCCSPRHIYRLSDANKMPQPVRLGTLVRWSRAVIEAWIVEGCQSCRKEVR